jgi:hypothetical protein
MSLDVPNVTRRGFLGAIAAFTAAVASGVRMPAGIAKSPPLPAQCDLLAILKDCRVESYAHEFIVDSYARLNVTYRHAPHEPRTTLDDLVDKAREGRLPISASVQTHIESIDVSEFGSAQERDVVRPVHTVEIVFA